MTSRQLLLLCTAALAIIAVAIWLGISRSPTGAQSTLLYPALKGQLGKVQTMQIYQAGDQLVVELARGSSGSSSGSTSRWTLKQRNNYPADDSKINSLLVSLESATIREEKTSNPDNYAALGVQDLSVAGATGTRVELGNIEPVVKLIVGKADAMSRSTYVRRAGEATSYLISEQLDLSRDASAHDATAWLKHDLLNIDADRIQEAVIQLTNTPRYSIVKAQRGDTNFDVTPLPKGREVNSVSAPNAIAQALVNLQLDDVRPSIELANEKSTGITSIHTFDGLVLEITGFNINGKQWMTVKASFDEALVKRFQLPTTDNAGSLESAIKKSREEIESLNKQLNGWAYAVAPYKYEAIFKPIEDLLKKKDNLLKKPAH